MNLSTKPFHQAIVIAINNIAVNKGDQSMGEIVGAVRMLALTTIPTDHLSIFPALTMKTNEFGGRLPTKERVSFMTELAAMIDDLGVDTLARDTADGFRNMLDFGMEQLTAIDANAAAHMPLVTNVTADLRDHVASFGSARRTSPAEKLGESSGYSRRGGNVERSKQDIVAQRDDGEGKLLRSIAQREAAKDEQPSL